MNGTQEVTLPPLPASTLEVVSTLAIVAVLAVSASIVLGGLLGRALGSLFDGGTPREQTLIKSVVRLTRIVICLVLFVALAFPALDVAGVAVPDALRSDRLWAWLASTGVRMAIIIVLAAVLVRVTSMVAVRAEQDLGAGTGLDALERRKRAQTIGSLARRTLSFLIWSMALLIVLRELDIDITPVLAGAGIVGLAVGFGAQTLVRDVISGFFIIFEDQVRVGDVAEVNGRGGLVEQINLRTIVLRDMEGAVHVVPNGAITTLVNRTKDFSYYVLDLPMDYEDDTDEVTDAVREAANELVAEPAWAPHVLAPLEVLGVDAFGDSRITLKFRIKTVPLKQWDVGRELRRRVKKVFDAKGIRIPYPQLKIHLREPLTALRDTPDQ